MAVSKNSLANLKPCGKKFSKDYQPDRRKLSLFRMLANIIGEQELDVSFTKEDFYKCYQYIIELNEEQIFQVIEDPQTPIDGQCCKGYCYGRKKRLISDHRKNV